MASSRWSLSVTFMPCVKTFSTRLYFAQNWLVPERIDPNSLSVILGSFFSSSFGGRFCII